MDIASQFAPDLFKDKRVIVTGGGSGLGFDTAKAFHKLGARVAICGRNTDKLAKAAEQLEGLVALQCDIREPDNVSAFVTQVIDELGGVDILVNNAGGQFPSAAENISANGFNAVIRNNLCGTFNMTREVATQAMIPASSGRIVNIIANIYRGFPGMAHTGAARAGVENLTMSLAVEWARHNILVNAIAPGIIQTSGLKQYPPEIMKHVEGSIPLGRMGSSAEVVGSIVFLASPMASFTTGTTIRIDGAHSLAGDLWMRVMA